MGLKEDCDFSAMQNEAEQMVIQEMEEQLADSNVCQCEDCILDIATFALNRLKPRYRVSLMGALYAHAGEDADYGQKVKIAVSTAIGKIRGNPSH